MHTLLQHPPLPLPQPVARGRRWWSTVAAAAALIAFNGVVRFPFSIVDDPTNVVRERSEPSLTITDLAGRPVQDVQTWLRWSVLALNALRP